MRYADLKEFNKPASLFLKSSAPVAAFGGGVGNQKTTAGCVKVLQDCANHPGTRWIVGRITRRALLHTTQAELSELVQSLRWEKRYNKQDGIQKLVNGSELLYWHFDEAPQRAIEKLENITIGGFWLDQAEQFTEQYLHAGMRRLRHQKGSNQTLLTFNPAGHDWLWKMLKNPATRDADCELFEGTTYDNAAYLPPQFLERLKKLPPDLYKRFVLGSWDVLAGMVFSQYLDLPTPTGHVCPAIGKPPKSWPKWRAIDHGYRHPAGCDWITKTPTGEYKVYRVYKQEGRTATENGAAIAELSGDETYEYDVMDSACFSKTGQDLTIAEEYVAGSKGRIAPVPSRKSDDASMINRVAEWLIDRNSPDNSPRLQVCEDCQALRDEFTTWKWSDATRQILRQEKPEDANNDLLDPLIYFAVLQAMTDPQPKPPPAATLSEMLDARIQKGIEKMDRAADRNKSQRRRRF